MRASRLSSVISRLRNALEGSIKAQIEGLDVHFYISNNAIYTLDVELRYVFLKNKKIPFPQLKKNVFEESYLDFEMSYDSL